MASEPNWMAKDTDPTGQLEGVLVSNSTALKPQGSGIGRLLRKIKGQRDESTPFSHHNIPTSEASDELAESSDNSKGDISNTRINEETSFEQYYVPIDTYEGKHRYDPKIQWSPQEERKLVRKLDYRICAWVCFMFFALQLDRGNIVQALSDNLLSQRCQGRF